MSPSFPSDDRVSPSWAHLEATGDLRVMDASVVEASHLQYTVVIQFRKWVARTLLGRLRQLQTPLLECILRIVSLRSEEQMCWPDARRIIALMENVYSGGDRAEGDVPCHSAGDLGNWRQPETTALNAAITLLVSRSEPQPTLSRLINPFPERNTVRSSAAVAPPEVSLAPTGPTHPLILRRDVQVHCVKQMALWAVGLHSGIIIALVAHQTIGP